SPPVLQRLREVQRELPVLFEVDKERRESAAVRIAIEPTDKFGPSFLGKHDRVEELLRRWSRKVRDALPNAAITVGQREMAEVAEHARRLQTPIPQAPERNGDLIRRERVAVGRQIEEHRATERPRRRGAGGTPTS